jgi:hypothetical protein
MERVTAAIMAGALRYSAVDAFDAFATLNDLRAAARVEMAKVDLLLVPSAAHHYLVAGARACAHMVTLSAPDCRSPCLEGGGWCAGPQAGCRRMQQACMAFCMRSWAPRAGGLAFNVSWEAAGNGMSGRDGYRNVVGTVCGPWLFMHACAAVQPSRGFYVELRSAFFGPVEVEAEEKAAAQVSWPKNANLGRFTNFVNLMDMAAIAIPSGVLHCAEPAAASDPTGARSGQAHSACPGAPPAWH